MGSFGIISETAHFNEDKSVLYPPDIVFNFSEMVSPMAEKAFLNFLATELGVDERSANEQFTNFSKQFTTDFQLTNSAVLEGIGKLILNEDGDILFTPVNKLQNFLPILEMGEAFQEITESKNIKNEKSDFWWFYAILLIVIGLGALVYYYL